MIFSQTQEYDSDEFGLRSSPRHLENVLAKKRYTLYLHRSTRPWCTSIVEYADITPNDTASALIHSPPARSLPRQRAHTLPSDPIPAGIIPVEPFPAIWADSSECDACIPENTLDQSTNAYSRWSCKGDLVEDGGGCWIRYHFEDPTDLVEMRIAFYRGTEGIRTLNVYSNGDYHSTIQSSGNTNGYQSFDLGTDETESILLRLDDYESNPHEWLSITEVCRSTNIHDNSQVVR